MKLFSFLFIVSTLAGLILPVNADNNDKRGAYTMPYIRYDSQEARLGGNARSSESKDFNFHLTASEACNQEYITLTSIDDWIAWTLTEPADGVTLRFTLPDNKEGKSIGQESAVDILLNDVPVAKLAISSRWAWQYFKMNYYATLPYITDMPLMRFDEIHCLLSQSAQPGDEIKVRKAISDGIPCGIDFIETEKVPSSLPTPDNALSVTDFGAKADGKQDDLPAFYACMNEAKKRGKTVYIPPGNYRLNDVLRLDHDDLQLYGAGIWYTNLYFSNNGIGKGGICANANRLKLSGIYLNTVNTLRQEADESYRNYKGIYGNFGLNSLVQDMWVEHFECGMWIAGYGKNPKPPTHNLRVSRVRLRNNYADGVNFAHGTSHSIFEYSDIRNCGDDGIASWSSDTKHANRHNTFRFCTVEFGWRAGGIGIFGGGGHHIYNCYIGEMLMSAGIRFTSDFSGHKLDPTDPMMVRNCTLYKTGTTWDLFSNRLGAIDIHAGERFNQDNIVFENIHIIDSQSDGIKLRGGHIHNVLFKAISVHGIGKGYECLKEKRGGYGITTEKNGSAVCDFIFNTTVYNANPEIFKLTINKSNK